MKLSYYPGCSLQGTALDYDQSIREVCKALGVELVDIADKNKRYEMEDVFIGSQYLLMEAAHPCFDNVDIENPEELPEDLEEYFNYDEEDLRG